jgi:protein-tyrosine-phosphatase
MAEGLLKKLASDAGFSLEVASAGIAAFPGVPVALEAVQAGRDEGFDISSHQSQPLGKALVTESDLILTMTGKHRDMIVKKMPDLAPKVRLLSEFAGEGDADLEDPVGQPVEEYRKVLAQMKGYLVKSLDKFK